MGVAFATIIGKVGSMVVDHTVAWKSRSKIILQQLGISLAANKQQPRETEAASTSRQVTGINGHSSNYGMQVP